MHAGDNQACEKIFSPSRKIFQVKAKINKLRKIFNQIKYYRNPEIKGGFELKVRAIVI